MAQTRQIAPVTPADSGEAFVPLPRILREAARQRPQRPALRFEGRTTTWAELDRRLDRVARRLLGLGLGPRDKVAILSHTCPEYVEMFLGAVRAGACAVPLPSMARGETLEMMIDDSDARVLLVSASLYEVVRPFADRLANLVAGGRVALDFGAEGWMPFEAWLAEAGAEAVDVEIQEEYPFNIIYSSGTTGVPKGIVHDHCMRSRQFLGRMSRYGFDRDAVTLVSTPFYSNTTLVAALPTLIGGGTLVLMRKFDVAEFLRLSQSERVTHAMLVPVQYQRILAHPDFDRYDLGAYRVKLSTSAPLRSGVIRELLARWPGKVYEIYGLTEGGVSTVLDAASFPDKLDSVGRPGPGVQVRIIDDEGKELPPGETGEIVGRATTMMAGYYKRPDLTEALFWYSPEGELFLRTGDLGRFDGDGFLYVLDRKKDMIISGGFNVYASDLEQVLLQHEAVAEAAVIGIPSERWGETPLGLVVPKPDQAITEAGLLGWANERLGKGQRLAAVEFRDHLPRSSIGKVLKRELRQPYWESGKAR